MSAQENIATVRRLFEEAFNTGDLTLADAALDPNYVDHSTFAPPAPGVEGFKLRMLAMRKTFPDLHFSVDDIFADGSGDKVTFRWTSRGTDQGGIMGRPATGKLVVVTGINIEYLAGGKIVEHWSAPDNLSMMQQLGVIPAPAQSGS